MGSYYKHKRRESIDVPYSFRCEQCMQDSGPLNATITAEAEINSNFKSLSEKKQEQLRDMAHKNLVHEVREAHKKAEEKQIFVKAFKDECPHCHKPQSWAISGAKNEMFNTPIVCVILGLIIGACCYFFSGLENAMTLAIGAFAICCVIGLVVLVVNMVKIGSKKKQTSTAAQQFTPVIEWRAVQNILNEE